MKKEKNYFVLLVLMFLFSVSSFHAQTNSKSTKNNKKTTKKKSEEPKFPSYFGFSVRSIIPSSFTGKQSHTISSDYLGKPFTTTFAQKYGYSFGGTVRVGITKSDRNKEMLELAVEAGVDRIIPWQSERSISKWQSDSEQKWQVGIKQSCKQARQVKLPQLMQVMSTSEVIKSIGESVIFLDWVGKWGVGKWGSGEFQLKP